MNVMWAEHTWEQIRALAQAGAIAVAPFGSTEQHGPMLPLDTDTHIAERLAVSGAQEAWHRFQIRALVLPTLPVGLATHHMGFPGTLTLQPDTYLRVVREILDSAVTHGFRRIAVISGHGGNTAGLDLAIRHLVWQHRHESPPLRIALFRAHEDTPSMERRRAVFVGEPSEGQPAIHASRWETSEALADRPHLVNRERMVRPTLKVSEIPEWTWFTDELSETGAFGDPSLARADLGHQLWEMWAEAVALFIKRLHDASA